jgi:hypothetical protein
VGTHDYMAPEVGLFTVVCLTAAYLLFCRHCCVLASTLCRTVCVFVCCELHSDYCASDLHMRQPCAYHVTVPTTFCCSHNSSCTCLHPVHHTCIPVYTSNILACHGSAFRRHGGPARAAAMHMSIDWVIT